MGLEEILDCITYQRERERERDTCAEGTAEHLQRRVGH